MPATAEPPAATAAAPAATPTPPATDNGISHGAQATGAKPSTFRPPNPAFDRAAKNIQAKADKAAGIKPAPAEIPKPDILDKAKPEGEGDSNETDKSKTDDGKPEGTETAETAETEGAEGKDKKDKKVSPWRLVDQWKKTANDLKLKAEAAEQELSKIKAGAPVHDAASKDLTARLEKAESRIKEYEEEIRFKSYEKHPEFIEKYKKPYDAAWGKAIRELSEVGVTDTKTGETRAATAEDMLALVNLPLGKAREYSDQLFGAFSDDAMAHRKEIKGLFETQQEKLKEAREGGLKWESEKQQQAKVQQETMAKAITETWQSANREAVTDQKFGKYFAPVEGDQEGNSALAKGFELVDKAFQEDPRDPSITPEERNARIRRHVAMRNRAAAFGRLRRWNEKNEATIVELRKELEDYKKSEPGTGGGSSRASTSAPSDPFDRFKSAIMKKAGR